ncbi:MAG: hypothetical protein KF901_00735 [Myxococcales bacterium]|nr:hypothetical protein [Myxococcales bacterium]
MLRLSLLFALTLFTLSPHLAEAQNRWLVVHADTRPFPVERMRAAEQALEAEGVDIVPGTEAASRAESSLSLPFWIADESLKRDLGVATEAVLTAVARGEDQRAIDQGLPVLERLENQLAALGRDERAGEDVANLCLYVVRAFLQKRDPGAARRQALTCLRLAPGFTPTPRLHPPEVRALLEEIGPTELGVLAVQVMSSGGDGSECTIRMQGRVTGRGPRVRRTVPPGRYEVQVECADRPGRVHVVRVSGESPARLDVDVQLDSALRTDGGVALVYEDESALSARAETHLRRMAAWVGATRLLVHAQGAWTAWQVDGAGLTRIESFSAPEASSAALARRVAELVRGRGAGEGVGDGGEVTGPGGRNAVVGGTGRVWIAGLLVSAAGLAVHSVGWVYRSRMLDKELEFRDATFSEGFLSIAEEIESNRRTSVGFAAAGGAVLTLGWGFLMPKRPGVPWWSWILGAVGAGITAWGVIETTRSGECIGPRGMSDECFAQSGPWVRGPLLLGYGVPLLMTPLVYAIRNDAPAGSPRATLHFGPQAGAGRVGLQVGGTF